mmetsp:Transcript_16210/g.37349  ORF Transcript_16210/g.37349 Transcript_16210/m.37349 type:complete len:83 (+) Transcript_16210:3-251(+)
MNNNRNDSSVTETIFSDASRLEPTSNHYVPILPSVDFGVRTIPGLLQQQSQPRLIYVFCSPSSTTKSGWLKPDRPLLPRSSS